MLEIVVNLAVDVMKSGTRVTGKYSKLSGRTRFLYVARLPKIDSSPNKLLSRHRFQGRNCRSMMSNEHLQPIMKHGDRPATDTG